jgi:TRAP-type C4-dicarboxylate transport system substrate-binding protein
MRLHKILLGIALALGASFAAAEDKPVELKLAHWFPPAHPLQKALEEWAGSVERASNGSIRYKIFPAEQSGKAQEHYDLVRDGKADLAYVEPANQLARFPVMAAGALPLLMSNAKGGSAALDEWYRPYAAREMKEVKYCYAFVHEPGTIHSRAKKLPAPADIRGMKIRPANAMVGAFIHALGGINMPASEAASRALLEGGAADAVISSWGAVTFFGLDKAAKYHLDLPLYVSPLVLVMNKAAYEAMSVPQRRVIDDHCSSQWAIKAAGPWADVEAAARRGLQSAPGHEVYAVTADQLAAWRSAAAPLLESWTLNARKAGVDPAAAMEGLKAGLAKYKAAY